MKMTEDGHGRFAHAVFAESHPDLGKNAWTGRLHHQKTDNLFRRHLLSLDLYICAVSKFGYDVSSA